MGGRQVGGREVGGRDVGGARWASAKWGKDTVTFCDLNAVLYPQNAAWLLA